MSTRTRSALAAFGVSDPGHLSRQLDDEMADAADMVAVFEPMHVRYIQKHHADLAARSASLPRLARDLNGGSLDTVAEELAALDLGRVEFEPWEEVIDPAGGDLAEFEAAAASIEALITRLCHNLGV